MKNKFLELANEISHLTVDDIEMIYKRYLSGEKNSVLVKEYELDINPNKLIKILPPQILMDQVCPYCDVPMYKKRESKSQSSWNKPPIECLQCEHKIHQTSRFRQDNCSCQNCEVARIESQVRAEEEKRKILVDKYNPEKRVTISYSDLSFTDKLLLLTLFRMQTDGNFDHIIALNDPAKTEIFTPTSDMSIECLKELFDKRAIIVDPQSILSAFVEEEDFDSFYISKVQWIPNVILYNDKRSSLNELYHEIYKELAEGIQPHWEKDIFNILFRIAREEVLQYVYIKSDELNVSFSAENKTREVVNQLLHNFSVSEIYYFVKKSIENAHIYHAKGYAQNKKHAGNTIPNKMLSLGERALNEQWNTYKYTRDSRAPRSAISKIFYDFFLHDEDAGFVKSPGKYWEQVLFPRNFCRLDGNEEAKLACKDCNSSSVEVKMNRSGIELHCQDCGSICKFTLEE
ncbi:hypothetical protein ABQG55_03225 [Aeromonas dhakensis]|uniref:hypothetical protein n=1 Tax=Aeromonas dhakensis TaxID=196024 RepID=UPI0032EFDAC2